MSDFTLTFHKGETGLWFVTCEQPPSIFIAHQNIETILDDLPNILRLRLKRQAETAAIRSATK